MNLFSQILYRNSFLPMCLHIIWILKESLVKPRSWFRHRWLCHSKDFHSAKHEVKSVKQRIALIVFEICRSSIMFDHFTFLRKASMKCMSRCGLSPEWTHVCCDKLLFWCFLLPPLTSVYICLPIFLIPGKISSIPFSSICILELMAAVAFCSSSRFNPSNNQCNVHCRFHFYVRWQIWKGMCKLFIRRKAVWVQALHRSLFIQTPLKSAHAQFGVLNP